MSSFDVQQPIVELPDQDPDPAFSDDELVWTDEEEAQIEAWKDQYPEDQAAIMKVLWLAQEKFGYLAPEVIQLCADTLDMTFTQAYGVATFYHQYFKEEKGTYVLDVCTCFTCQVCGGYDVLHYLEETLDIHAGETTDDGMFTIQEAECLGSCGSAPMMEITNGVYVHNLTPDKIDDLVESLRAGEVPSFTSMTLPQDEEELDGNRRTDVENTETYQTQPRAEHTE
ncbi:NADH-quinone oxidoreductase subunit E [Salinibacter ruber]|uniref:NADH-quinone oxidoreductase subunit NuoE family protein n=1 Tax=Salinibacter ruber TaxID=146919 RepID=UPI002168DD14|nr:NAD(P)H-dependent oxidoreductase subunit E [Salinibacter ruber]MCS4189455.1 NADH-quinone oxidoreductase subunit E [Salinibacter ruber]